MKILILFLLIISCSTLRSQSTTKVLVKSKVNSNGQYLLFPGITVVSSIGAKNREIWAKVFKDLNKSTLIKRYYALLPLNSYHMTTINLFTQKGTAGNWSSFVEERLPWFQKLNTSLANYAFQPLVIKLEPELSGQTIKLSIQLDSSQKEKINYLAKEFFLEKKVPVPFHVTLGYLYQDITDINKKKVIKEFEFIINNILNSYNNSIIFQEPKLCYFYDMTEFIPWDGKYNPFVR